MAINYNNNNQGIGDLDLSQYGLIQPESTNMQVAGGYDTPTAGAYGFNLIELDRLKNAGYNPGEVSNWENKEDVQNLIRSLEPQASAVNESGYPLTASLSGAVPNRVSATEDIDIDSLRNPFESFQNETIEENSIPQNFRTRMNNPFFERPTLSNASSPANYFNQGLGGVKGIKEKMGQGWDFAQQLPGMAMSALSGIPGIGALMGMLPKTSPEQKAMMDLYNSGEYQDVLGQIPGAENLNPVYGMGAGYGLSGALGKRLAMRNSQKTQDRISKLSQQRRDKFAAQSAAIEQAISLEKAKIGARIGASGKIPTSGGGGTSDQGGTYGGYSYGGEGQQAGRQGYGYGLRDGGLATLFARRG